MFRLFLLFTLAPIGELYLLVKLGQVTSAELVIGLVAVTGLAGAALAKHQGLGLLRRIQADMEAGRLPAEGLMDGLLILLGGAFLITPGVVTDALGLCMLIPWTRRLFKRAVKAWLKRKIDAGALHVHYESDEPDERYDIDMDDPRRPRP